MEERSYRVVSNDVSVVRRTRCFRLIELILCVVCLLLAIFFWTSIHSLTITTVVIFATSLSFFIITLIDVIAGLSRNQYTITAWVGIAFLAAFMFFLSFGFLLFRSRFPLAVLAFLITAIVFIIDGTLIICYLYRLHSSKRVHPTTDHKIEEKEKTHDEIVMDEFVQTDTSEPINEGPAQVRTYAPRASNMSRRSFPITTYGGTFPMGEKDAAPLPTPDNLTGLEPSRSSQIHVTKKSTREMPADDRSRGMEDVSTQKPSIYEGSPMYPPLEEEMVEKQSYAPVESARPKTYETYEQSDISSIEREIQSPIKMCNQESEVCRLDEKISICRRDQEDVQTETNWSYNPEDMQGRTVRPCQAAGEPLIQQPLGVFTIGSRPQDYQRRNCPNQECQCCNRQAPTRDQASTVVRGAVRQYPQDTAHEQQKMIQAQLEQSRQVYGPHVCGCHEQATTETKQPQNRREPRDSTSTDHSVLLMPKDKEKNFEHSNLSLYGSSCDGSSPAKYTGSSASYGEDRFIFEDDADSYITLPPESTKRVTIVSEPLTSSSGRSATHEYEGWLKRMKYNEDLLRLPDDERRVSGSVRKTAPEGDENGSEKINDSSNNQGTESDDGAMHPDRTPTVMKLSKQLYSSPETGDKLGKKFVSPSSTTTRERRISEIPHFDNSFRRSSGSENTDNSPPRKRRVVPCVKRCWETPKGESTMKSLYTYKGPSMESTFIENIANRKSWGTEVTTTTTVRTTNFGNDNGQPVTVREVSAESSYASSKSPEQHPAIIDSSPEDRSNISRETVRKNKSNAVTNEKFLGSQDEEKHLDDYRCFVPCCTLPPLDDHCENVQVVPIEEEQTELEEQRTEVAALDARRPADEVELRRRSILKNRKQIDEDIREELSMVEEEPAIEQKATHLEQVEKSDRESREIEEATNDERRSTLEMIKEHLAQEKTHHVEYDSEKWEKIEVRKEENKTVVKNTCGCICKCLCRNAQMAAFRDTQRRSNKSFDANKYYVTSLNELPYHPRDDYKLDNNSLVDSMDSRKNKNSVVQERDADYFWENPVRNSRVSRIPETFTSSKWKEGKRDSEAENLGIPIDSETLRGEARGEQRGKDSVASSSVPKRGPVKRVHPNRK